MHVGLDLNRMTTAAIEAALDDDKQRRPRLTGKRAVAAGAALALAARVAIKRGPGLPGISRLTSVPEHLRERLGEHGWLPDGDEREDEPSDEAAQDEYDDDEEPEAEAEDEYDEEEDEEPEAEASEDEYDEEEDDEPEAEASEDEYDEEEDEEPKGGAEDDDEPEPEAVEDDEDAEEDEPDEPQDDERVRANGAAREAEPGLLDVLSMHRSRPPAMSRRRRARAAIDPAARPPEPPERSSDREREADE
jgi:hypothetical protein